MNWRVTVPSTLISGYLRAISIEVLWFFRLLLPRAEVSIPREIEKFDSENKSNITANHLFVHIRCLMSHREKHKEVSRSNADKVIIDVDEK